MELPHAATTTGQPEDALSPAERLEHRNRELRILYSISEALNRATDVHTSLETTLTLVAELLGLRSAWVWLLDAEERPYLAASRHLPPFLQEPSRMEGWLCLCLRTYLEGDMEGAANVNVLECSRLRNATSGSEGLRYHASIPLYLGEKRVGVMNVAGPNWRRLSPSDLQLLHTIGNQVAVAVERSRLSEESARTARLQERNRLAREIHDTLAQDLAAISLQLETADVLFSSRPEQAHERVQTALELAREGLGEARRSVQDLRAAQLEGRTLAEALQELATHFGHQTGVETCVEVQTPLPDLAADTEAALYRIVQESLTNVHKHSGARSARVTLEVIDGTLYLHILDDGKGFVHDSPGASSRFGLIGMRERARLLGGDLSVESAEGEGVRVTVQLPVPPQRGERR